MSLVCFSSSKKAGRQGGEVMGLEWEGVYSQLSGDWWRVLSRQMLASKAQPLRFPRRISFKGAPSEEHVREASLGLLTGYLGSIVDAIVGSVERCPFAMRLAFKQLRRRVEERFPQAEHEVGTFPWSRWGD